MDSRATFSTLSLPEYERKIDISKRPKSYYKPLIHHTTAFVVLLLIASGLLALVEWARQILPHSPWDMTINSIQGNLTVRQELSKIDKMEVVDSETPLLSTITADKSTLAKIGGKPSSLIVFETGHFWEASETAYLDTTALTIIAPSPVSTMGNDASRGISRLTKISTSGSAVSTTETAASNSEYLDTSIISATPFTIISVPSSATAAVSIASYTYSNSLDYNVTPLISEMSISAHLYASTITILPLTVTSVSPNHLAVATTAGSAALISHLDISMTTTSPQMTSTTNSFDYLNTAVANMASLNSNFLYESEPGDVAMPSYLDISLNSIGAWTWISTLLDSSRKTSVTLDSYTIPGDLVAVSSVYLDITISTLPNTFEATSTTPNLYSSPTTTVNPDGSAAPSADPGATIVIAIEPSILGVEQVSGQAAPLEAKHPLVLIANMNHFFGAYLGVTLAVVFRVIIGWLYSTTKMLEPFHMLKHKDGARAKDFFNINYLSANSINAPFTGILSGHWLMASASLLYATVGLLAPFASEMLHFNRSCEKFEIGDIICGAALSINSSVARIIEGMLVGICILLLVVWSLLQSLASGIYSDPSSIASVCSLLHHPETVAELQLLDQCASKEAVVRNLSGKRYQLDTYQSTDGLERYGLITSGDYADDETDNIYECVATVDFLDKPVSKLLGISEHRHSLSRRMFHFAIEMILPTVTAATLILVICYYKDNSDDGYNRFLNSQGFGPRFLITCVGIIIHTQWARLEREHSIFEPFRRFFVALVAFVAVTAEVLIIVLPSVPFNSGELFRAYTTSSYLSMAILTFMLIVLVAIWLRPKGLDLPRKPNTLGALCLYLCDSQIRFDLADMAYMGKDERDHVVKDLEREYALICGLGLDGEIRWRVDYENHDEHE